MLWCERIFYCDNHHSFREILPFWMDESFFFLSFFWLTNNWFQFVRQFCEVPVVCAELLLVNKSVLQLNRYFLVVTYLGRPGPSFLFMVPLPLKRYKKSFYGCVSPVFRWMAFPNFLRRPPFFFKIILNDDFVFFWKRHCEQIVTKRHCEQRGTSLTIYSNANASEDTALYFLGKKPWTKQWKGTKIWVFK